MDFYLIDLEDDIELLDEMIEATKQIKSMKKYLRETEQEEFIPFVGDFDDFTF